MNEVYLISQTAKLLEVLIYQDMNIILIIR